VTKLRITDEKITFVISVYWLAFKSFVTARNTLKFKIYNAYTPLCINYKSECRNISYAIISQAWAV